MRNLAFIRRGLFLSIGMVLCACGTAGDRDQSADSDESESSSVGPQLTQSSATSAPAAKRTYTRSRKDLRAAQYATGRRDPTAAEAARDAATARAVVDIKPTSLAVERVQAHAARSRKQVASSAPVAVGADLVTAPSAAASTATASSAASAAVLPSGVDNSALPAFPEIRSQGDIGSCVAFAVGYYQYTHELGLLRGWNNHNGANSTKISPKWVYNLVNGGFDGGTYPGTAYDILLESGALTWEDFPYEGDHSNPVNYREWPRTAPQWEKALQNKALERAYLDVPTNGSGLSTLKNVLLNGHVVSMGTHISTWEYDSIDNDPATTADDSVVGQAIATWVDGFDPNAGHQMTVVGYNDDIWVDLNDNGKVDAGERGALKIANSWGTDWQNGGFVWLAYDALFKTSEVAGGPASSQRRPAIEVLSVVTPRASYTPALVAEYTLNAFPRYGIVGMAFGVTETDRTQPFMTWSPMALTMNVMAGAGDFGFDGTSTSPPQNATFAFDLSELSQSYADVNYQFSMSNNNSAPAVLSGLTLVDNIKSTRTVTTNAAVSIPNFGTGAQSVHYLFQNPAAAPKIETIPVSGFDFGPAPLGRSSPHTISLKNTGTGDAIVSSLRFDSPIFYSTASFPIRIPAGTAAPVEVRYAPASTQADSGTLSVKGTSAATVPSLALSGRGSSLNPKAPLVAFLTQQNSSQAYQNAISMRIEVKNQTTAPIQLSDYRIVYYFSRGSLLSIRNLVWDTYYSTIPGTIGAAIGGTIALDSTKPRSADATVAFTFPAGTTLAPNATAILDGALHAADWSWYPIQTNNWSRFVRNSDKLAEGIVVQNIATKNIVFGVSPEQLPYSLTISPTDITSPNATATFVVTNPSLVGTTAQLIVGGPYPYPVQMFDVPIGTVGTQTFSWTLPAWAYQVSNYNLMLDLDSTLVDAVPFTVHLQ